MHKAIVFALLLASSSVFAGEQALRFGVTTLSSREPACATFKGLELIPGQRVIVAAFDFDRSRWFEGGVIKKRLERCKTFDALEGVAYDVHIDTTETYLSGAGVAVVADTSKKLIKNERPVFFLRGNELAIDIHICTSYEALHYSAWQGRHRIWHEYEPLGYDTEPTCTKEDSER